MDRGKGEGMMKSDNPFLSMIAAKVDQAISQMCADAGQMTLGELVARLEALPLETPIYFEDGTSPGIFDSYRGYYHMLAIKRGKPCTVADLLAKARDAIGRTFEGYKGGEFRMTKHTPVWVSEYGIASGVGLVGVKQADDKVILEMAMIDD